VSIATDVLSSVVSSAVASTAEASPTANATTVASAMTSSPATATTSSAGSSSSGAATVNGKAALTPNGIKAGMTLCDGIDEFSGKLGWCYGTCPVPVHGMMLKSYRLDPEPLASFWHGRRIYALGRWSSRWRAK
jgi:hypothetical protein